MEFRPLSERSLITGNRTRNCGFAAISHCGLSRFGRITALVSLLFAFNAAADTQADRVDRVKAAFVLNIARFVSWPPEVFESQDSHLLLCFYRSNPINQAAEMIQGEIVAGRPVTLTRIENLAKSASCHILLIAHDKLREYIKEASAGLIRPMLTIADLTEIDTSKIQGQDIIISLVRNDTRIGFEINLNKSRQAGLKMSSQLLKLATIVGDGP